jgi:hypothetical protein
MQRVGCRHDTREAPCSYKINPRYGTDPRFITVRSRAHGWVENLIEEESSTLEAPSISKGSQQNLSGGSIFDLPYELCVIAPHSSGPIEIRCMPPWYLCFNSCQKLPAFVFVCLRKCIIMWMRNGIFGMNGLLKSSKRMKLLSHCIPNAAHCLDHSYSINRWRFSLYLLVTCLTPGTKSAVRARKRYFQKVMG